MTDSSQNYELNDDSSATIDISNGTNGQMDDYGYITNLESMIEIRIDKYFMELIEDAGINSEPEVNSLKRSAFVQY